MRHGDAHRTADRGRHGRPRRRGSVFRSRRDGEETPILEVSDLKVSGYAARTSFTVHAGAIFGLGGLVGAGRSELLEAIFGLRPPEGGIRLGGNAVPRPSPAESIRRGAAFVPEDRELAGVLISLSVIDNVTLPHLAGFTGAVGLVDNAARRAKALDVLKRMPELIALGHRIVVMRGGAIAGELPRDRSTRGPSCASPWDGPKMQPERTAVSLADLAIPSSVQARVDVEARARSPRLRFAARGRLHQKRRPLLTLRGWRPIDSDR